ncbi:glycosyltransferase family 4 protein [Terricaulis silvestris]|uniref:glycosyltransferase family 4 protein n=1 Tax=Terricaulis silvestris TaxID=2686094 RepID=UPI002B219233|nr:glycosyltransferase family 4 protein [Terricaulis silvestris]
MIDAICALDYVKQIDILPRRRADPPTGIPMKAHQHAERLGRIAYATGALRAARNRPDIVFCNHLYMAPLAAFVAYMSKAKLVIQLHGIEMWPVPSPIRRRAIERADFLWCVSRDTRARALAHADIKPERAIVVNNGVRPEFVPGNRAAAKQRFGTANEITLLSLGRLDPRERYKGHDRVIGALPHLITCCPDLGYLIGGEGEDRSRLEALARQRGVASHVRFLGNVEARELPDLYRAADLFALPSVGEGFGIAFLEAMACGTPAIGLAIGGATDALADGELGACVAEVDFAGALQSALTAPRPNPDQLSAAVHARFGRAVLRERVAQSLSLAFASNICDASSLSEHRSIRPLENHDADASPGISIL